MSEAKPGDRCGLSPDRCGECDNCRYVRLTAKLLMPNPPFTHADNQTVEIWNETLREHPCLNKLPPAREVL